MVECAIPTIVPSQIVDNAIPMTVPYQMVKDSIPRTVPEQITDKETLSIASDQLLLNDH